MDIKAYLVLRSRFLADFLYKLDHWLCLSIARTNHLAALLIIFFTSCIAACGHISRFRFVHRAMHGLWASYCAICRQQYYHFPSICQLLHLLLLKWTLWPTIKGIRKYWVSFGDTSLDLEYHSLYSSSLLIKSLFLVSGACMNLSFVVSDQATSSNILLWYVKQRKKKFVATYHLSL